MVGSECPACHGKRLKREALSVTFAGLDIGALSRLPLARVADLLGPIARGELPAHTHGNDGDGAILGKRAMREATERRVAAGGSAHKASPDVRRTPNLSDEKRIAAQRIAAELLERLTTLHRSRPRLPRARSRDAHAFAGRTAAPAARDADRSQLFGVVYVLDEPSAGLHPADGEALLRSARAPEGGGQFAVRRRARSRA